MVVTDYPDNDDMMVTLTTRQGVYKGAYYRLRHKTHRRVGLPRRLSETGQSVVCNGPEPGLGTRQMGVVLTPKMRFRVLLASARIRRKKRRRGTQLGTITYEKPTWLAVFDRDLDQEFRGYHLIGHQLRDVRMKFRLVTYDTEAVGDKYQFSETISAANLTAADDLTLSDDGDGFVKLSFSGGLKE